MFRDPCCSFFVFEFFILHTNWLEINWAKSLYLYRDRDFQLIISSSVVQCSLGTEVLSFIAIEGTDLIDNCRIELSELNVKFVKTWLEQCEKIGEIV